MMRRLSSRPVHTMSVYASLFLSAFVMVQCQDQELTGLNVCIKQEVITEEKMVPTREPTQIATKTWCLSIPPRCTTYKTVYKVVYKPQMQSHTKMVKKCCDGYILHSNGTCQPYCMNQCINGQCVAPNKCDCNPGFSGDTCTQKCPLNKWGPQCTKDCKCQNGASCNAVSGKCDCEDGWKGESCSEPCQIGQYGHWCLEVCRCENGAVCDHVTGACKCTPGFCGPLCEKACESDSGSVCDRCQNGGSCQGPATNCTCLAGWTGAVCANPCEEGFWGKDCKKTCKTCHNNGTCDHLTGSCICPSGYSGSQCEKQCEPGRFGPNCQTACECQNAQFCEPVTGVCHCFNGYKGDKCELRNCPDGKYGKYCNDTCKCSNMSACHPVDGACMCKPFAHKLGGTDCAMCCILSGGDSDCYKQCETSEKWLCAAELNGCVCLPPYSGPECRVSANDDVTNLALRNGDVAVARSDNTGLIVGLCIAVLVLLIILVMAMFYRRRVKRLQDELATVAYSSSSGTDSDEGSRTDLNRAENFLYLGGEGGSTGSTGGKSTSVHLKNGETFVKVAEPLPKKPVGNLYVSMPAPAQNDYSERDSIYQSIEYETPTGRHQYASVDEKDGNSAQGVSNLAFENQLYNHNKSLYGGHAPPSYEAAIIETLSSTHPPPKST